MRFVLVLGGVLMFAAGPARGECVSATSSQNVDNFVGDPDGFLASFPQGGDPLIYQIRDFAVASQAARVAIAAAVPKSNMQQKAAIGAGLARAEAACAGRFGDVARKISALAHGLSDQGVLRAYNRYSAGAGANSGVDTPAEAPESSKRLGLEHDLGPVSSNPRSPVPLPGQRFFSK